MNWAFPNHMRDIWSNSTLLMSHWEFQNKKGKWYLNHDAILLDVKDNSLLSLVLNFDASMGKVTIELSISLLLKTVWPIYTVVPSLSLKFLTCHLVEWSETDSWTFRLSYVSLHYRSQFFRLTFPCSRHVRNSNRRDRILWTTWKSPAIVMT